MILVKRIVFEKEDVEELEKLRDQFLRIRQYFFGQSKVIVTFSQLKKTWSPRHFLSDWDAGVLIMEKIIAGKNVTDADLHAVVAELDKAKERILQVKDCPKQAEAIKIFDSVCLTMNKYRNFVDKT